MKNKRKKKDGRGGKRKGAGRPATGNVKKTIAFYILESIIELNGGKDQLKKNVYKFLGQENEANTPIPTKEA